MLARVVAKSRFSSLKTKDLRRSLAIKPKNPDSGHPELPSNQVIVIAGATATGKSALSMEIANRYDAEIVCADSVTVYKHVNIGSSKPSPAEMAKVPHHLVDMLEPSEFANAGMLAREGAMKIKDIMSRGKLPILAGGTTMMTQWIVEGIPTNSAPSDPKLRAHVQELLQDYEKRNDFQGALALLAKEDEELAAKVTKNSWRRLSRYLEVALSGARKNPKDEREVLLEGVDVRTFFLTEDRMELHALINTRCQLMVEHGLFEEVHELLTKGILKPGYMAARAIGYRQVIEYFCDPTIEYGDLRALRECLFKFVAATRSYARTQHIWHRKHGNNLFVQVHRTKNRSVPYTDIATGLLNLCTMPSDEFLQLCKAQAMIADYVGHWTNSKTRRVKSDYICQDFIEKHVIETMLQLGILRTSENVTKDTKFPIQENSTFQIENTKIRNMILNMEILTRSAITDNKLSRYISSQLPNEEKQLDKLFLLNIIDKIDKMRNNLRKNHNEILKEFYNEWILKENTKGGDHVISEESNNNFLV